MSALYQVGPSPCRYGCGLGPYFSSPVAFAVFTISHTFVSSRLEMLLPVLSVAMNGLLSGDHGFQIEGVAYTGDGSDMTTVDGIVDGTRTSTSIRPRSSNSASRTYSRASMAGISVGCTLGILILFTGLFLYFRRQYRRKQRASPSCALPQTETAVGSSSHDASLHELAHTNSPSQVPGPGSRGQDFDSVVVVAHKGKEDV